MRIAAPLRHRPAGGARRPAENERVLEALGYRRRNGVSGALVSYEDLYCRNDGTVEHAVDLHWRVNNAQVFARALSHDEMHARSVPVPQLGEAAHALCPPHALLLACMHRAAHLGADGHDADRLIWLYDIHLLARGMDANEWQQFADLCVARAMRRITLDALSCTHEALATVFCLAAATGTRDRGADTWGGDTGRNFRRVSQRRPCSCSSRTCGRSALGQNVPHWRGRWFSAAGIRAGQVQD